MIPRTSRLLFLLLFLFLNRALSAQDSVPPQPFVRGGVFDKPYLATLAGRTAIGGYAEGHVRFQRVDGARVERGFELKRFNLFTATEVSDFVRIAAEIEIEEGGEELKLEYAAIDVRVHSAFTLRGGMVLSPIGRFNLSHDSPLNDFTDRPLVSTELLGTALSEPGIGALGTFRLATGRLTYELYATNGLHDGLLLNSPDGVRIAEGRGNVEDNNASPALVGRLAWSPNYSSEFGVSFHRGAYNVFDLDGLRVEEARHVTMRVVDLTLESFGFSISGEAAMVTIDLPAGLAPIYGSQQRGAYLDVFRDVARGIIPTMPNGVLSVGARFDVIDFDSDLAGDDSRQLSLGVNYRPTPESVLKLNYVRGREHDRFNNASDHASILFSLATYF